MDMLNELFAYKEKYEKEKLFVEAKIAVVDDMIADRTALLRSREPVVCNEENTENVGLQDETY
jgi:hypothetical protein